MLQSSWPCSERHMKSFVMMQLIAFSVFSFSSCMLLECTGTHSLRKPYRQRLDVRCGIWVGTFCLSWPMKEVLHGRHLTDNDEVKTKIIVRLTQTQRQRSLYCWNTEPNKKMGQVHKCLGRLLKNSGSFVIFRWTIFYATEFMSLLTELPL
jgi:hypothetical protein